MISESRFSEISHTFSNIYKASIGSDNNFRLQKKGENVQLYIGIDMGKYAISVVSISNELELTSTELIQVRKVETEPEGNMAVIFTLNDDDLLSIFISFAIDIESVIDDDNKVSIVEIYNRYLYWQKMFKAEKQQISESNIKGLINELHILENFMIPRYGIDEAVRGWVGSDNIHKDFAYNDGWWYEAKAVNVGKVTVNISSIEQLQAETEGVLMVSELEKTSSENSNGIRLFDQLNRIKSQIKVNDVELSFLNKVSSVGLSLDILSDPNHIANSYRYVIHGVKNYLVNDKFPCLTRKELTSAVGLVNYELILAKLTEYSVEFEETGSGM